MKLTAIMMKLINIRISTTVDNTAIMMSAPKIQGIASLQMQSSSGSKWPHQRGLVSLIDHTKAKKAAKCQAPSTCNANN